MKNNLSLYARRLQRFIDGTEAVGDKMNPYFEKVRKAIDQDQLAKLTKKELTEIHQVFTAGTSEYQELLVFLKESRPVAKVLGIHKQLIGIYEKYVESCQEMTVAVDKKVNVEKFNQSEIKQDEKTVALQKTIQKISSLLVQ